jgi:hypothetical protein
VLSRVLVVRTDSDGDVLLSGPAIRAVARRAEVTLLVSPSGEQTARLLPGVADVVVWPCPWVGFAPHPSTGMSRNCSSRTSPPAGCVQP